MKGSLYSVSDKAIFDAIHQSKVTNPELKSIFLSRGTIASSKTNREKLAEYFSLFPHSYFDYQKLSELLGTNTRREKNTSVLLEQKLSSDVVETAINDLIKDIEYFGGHCELSSSDSGQAYNINVSYREFNYRNSEFRQITNKEANISIESTQNGFIIRHPQNNTVDEWKAMLIAKLEAEEGQDIEVREISLRHIDKHSLITDFFTTLINDISGFELKDVTDVFVYHPKDESSDESNDDTSDIPDEEVELGTHISKAALKGQNVLRSEVLNDFYDKEFYISKVVWRSKVKGSVDEDLYEFEAQFSDPENKEQFSYLSKGFYSYLAQGQYTKNRKAFTADEERRVNKSIEAAAQRSLKGILEPKNEE